MEKVKGVDNFLLTWNALIKNLIEVEKCWKTLMKMKEKYDLTLNCFPDESQKILSKVNFRSRFVLGITSFITFISTSGSLSDCIIQRRKEKKEAENERR